MEWHIVALGRCYHHRTPFGRRQSRLLWRTQVMPCTHAYLMSRAGALEVWNVAKRSCPITPQNKQSPQ
eukprot:6163232-Amphidinium_carterae.1